jgi:hypothetical protein
VHGRAAPDCRHRRGTPRGGLAASSSAHGTESGHGLDTVHRESIQADFSWHRACLVQASLGTLNLRIMRVVILTWASGSGKIAIAEAIARRSLDLAEVLHFDRIGVPSPQAMAAGWGSAEAWQRATTLAWMARIAAMTGQHRSVLFEGQMRLAFVREGLPAAGLDDARVFLLDCDDATRERRLRDRDRSELANPTIMDWAKFLRREAAEAGCEVLDTSKLPLAAAVALISEYLRAAP